MCIFSSCIFIWKLNSQLTQSLSCVARSQMSSSDAVDQKSSAGVSSQGSFSSPFRGRAYSESVKPAVNQATLLFDDDPELPSWLNKGPKGGGADLLASTSTSGMNSEPHEFSIPAGRWADRAKDQFSLANAIAIAPDGDEQQLCDPHDVFGLFLS